MFDFNVRTHPLVLIPMNVCLEDWGVLCGVYNSLNYLLTLCAMVVAVYPLDFMQHFSSRNPRPLSTFHLSAIFYFDSMSQKAASYKSCFHRETRGMPL